MNNLKEIMWFCSFNVNKKIISSSIIKEKNGTILSPWLIFSLSNNNYWYLRHWCKQKHFFFINIFQIYHKIYFLNNFDEKWTLREYIFNLFLFFNIILVSNMTNLKLNHTYHKKNVLIWNRHCSEYLLC